MEKVPSPSAVVLLNNPRHCVPSEKEEGLGQMTDRLAAGVPDSRLTTSEKKNQLVVNSLDTVHE